MKSVRSREQPRNSGQCESASVGDPSFHTRTTLRAEPGDMSGSEVAVQLQRGVSAIRRMQHRRRHRVNRPTHRSNGTNTPTNSSIDKSLTSIDASPATNRRTTSTRPPKLSGPSAASSGNPPATSRPKTIQTTCDSRTGVPITTGDTTALPTDRSLCPGVPLAVRLAFLVFTQLIRCKLKSTTTTTAPPRNRPRIRWR